MTECPDYDTLLSVNQVARGDATSLVAHLAGCADCQERMRDLARMDGLFALAGPPAIETRSVVAGVVLTPRPSTRAALFGAAAMTTFIGLTMLGAGPVGPSSASDALIALTLALIAGSLASSRVGIARPS